MMAQWGRVRAQLRAEFGEAAFNSWLKPLTLSEVADTRVRIAVPTRFMRDWIDSNYRLRLIELWRAENAGIDDVEVIVEPAPTNSTMQKISRPATAEEVHAIAESKGLPREAPPPAEESAALDTRFTFNNFVVGRSNELAHAAARRVAESAEVPFNPLFLYGGVGLGKTHLMHGIAWHIRRRDPGRRVLYLSAEKFMYQFIRALRYKTTMDFKDQFRSVDVLMIDDIQFMADKGGVGNNSIERAFKLPDVRSDLVRKEFEQLRRDLGVEMFCLRLQNAEAQLIVGGMDVGDETPAEAGL